ncbi:MAG: hypothetical protein ABSA74_03155 [Candidatus Staskawiczbacteria bacterium]|jgi:hypothetical protein
MKIKELFQPMGISQSFNGSAALLDWNNCQIENRTKNEDSVMLLLKRKSDGEEGHAYLRPQDKFKSLAPQLLNWAFINNGIIGLTLNQLVDLETNLEIENLHGRLHLNKN